MYVFLELLIILELTTKDPHNVVCQQTQLLCTRYISLWVIVNLLLTSIVNYSAVTHVCQLI